MELLIVIVVIAILAAITIVAYNGIQTRAQNTKVDSDIASLEKAIHVARIQTGQTLRAITDQDCTRCSCPFASGGMTRYSTLPKTHACWTDYFSALDKIAAASGANLESLKAGDPWGSPYALDANEGEQVADPCRQDDLYSFGSSGTENGNTTVGDRRLSFSLSGCA